ncbi:hypothetical protein [Streptomyces spectabilis]|uniref:Uncharacterized protein n=1 Tax=Streptomyces spectabilis TaxID=68270 RepID=A0A7W8B3V0_STRST|nr:hypothetical protein [Streptomyces spectabilis]MBB5109818.1 hypothetical protein [Streptomyces spectabilis]GGV57947.1 hypothetical protein GCM10010245_91090 [Streptomyces spectabilis]
MRHGPEDVADQGGVARAGSQLDAQREVELGDIVIGIVESHPADQVGGLRGGGVHVTAHAVVREVSAEVTLDVSVEVLGESSPAVTSSPPLVYA